MPGQENDINRLTDHLFRHEAGKMIAVLTRLFGFHHFDLVEDVVQEAFARALQEWRFGLPDNPSGWLLRVARNRAIDVVRRQRYQKEFMAETSALLMSEYTASPFIDQVFLESEIQDSQLQMVFACCHPSLSGEDQIAFTLKTCSGFSVNEIAAALLTNAERIKKRLQRARAFLAGNNIRLAIPAGNELQVRLDVVLQTLYLLFNEGYYSSGKSEVIRKDLCQEAIRLALLLTEHPLVRTPVCDALVALLTLLSSRFEARLDEHDGIILLQDQDRSKWDKTLINIGLHYFERAMQKDVRSPYHLQAAIVVEHAIAKDFTDTNWQRILSLYDMLAADHPSPVILLNRAIVVSRVAGAPEAIHQIEQIPGIRTLLASHHLFAAVLGEMHKEAGNAARARELWQHALLLTQSPPEKNLLERKIRELI